MNKQAQSSLHQTFQHIPGHFYLWIATLIFAASSALTRKITTIGQSHLIDGRNPISLCNVLFVGNLCALAVMIWLFAADWQWSKLRRLRRRDWLSLAVIGLLSGALGPALIFAALDRTSVTNVVIISRLEAPLSLFLSFVLLGSRINRYTLLGAIVAFLGVAVTALLLPEPMASFHVGQGEAMVGIAAIILAIADVLSKIYLKTVSLGIFAVMRTAIGTIVFFMLAQVLYGSNHFAEVFSPFLWAWMAIYSFLIVIIGQLSWFTAQKVVTTAESTLANAFQPLIAIVMAFVILGEVPMLAQFVGGGILLLGIGLSAIGTIHDTKQRPSPIAMTPAEWLNMSSDYRGI
jgi:drug/metabolite transporter (DMT)-like permease